MPEVSRAGQPAAALPGGDAFFDAVMREMFEAVEGGRTQAEFDFERFPAGSNPACSAAQQHAFFNLLLRQRAAFAHACGLLADEMSRALFKTLLVSRLIGPARVRLPADTPTYWQARERARQMALGVSEQSGAFGRLSSFTLPFAGHDIACSAYPANVAFSFLLRQYYFHRGDVEIAPAAGDVCIDCGACYGDTALAFAASVGRSGRVHAFEIVPEQAAIARANFTRNPVLAASIALKEIALGDHAAERLYMRGRGPGAYVAGEPPGEPIEATSLDDFAHAVDLDHVDFIKMDIEGAELAALEGAVALLARFRPKLAISVYHRSTDLATIPAFLASLDLGYQFWLEHYTTHLEETVLYAKATRA